MNRWKHRWKRAASLAGAALVLAAGLAACAPAEESSSLPGEESSQLALENDGATTQLVVAEISHSPERTAALEEIAAKYMAQADLVELSQQEQPGAVEQGLLVDLEPYLDVWEERSSLTMAAKAVLSSMGNGRAFLMPITLNQDLVYYRSDWFEAYNQDKTEGLVYCRIWEDFIDAAEKLSDKGAAGLVFGGQEHLVDLFDSVLWSTTNVGRMADTAASYFSNVEGNTTEDQAVEAFINGEAITLIAGQDRMEEIAAAMDEGAWDVAGYPRGTAGLAVTSLEFTGFGVAASSQQVGNAVHFLTYLSGADNNTHLAKVCGTVPIHTTAADLEPSLEETGLAVNLLMVRRADWYYYAQEPVMYQALAAGDLGQQELLGQFDAYWTQALEDEGELWKSPEAPEAE